MPKSKRALFLLQRTVTSPVELVHLPGPLRKFVEQRRLARECIALIPTMGALHEGHLSLIDHARAHGAERVIVTIFVNPTQFGPSEDLAAYPRTLEQDCALLADRDVDLVFSPSVETIYPNGHESFVSLESLPNHLCGRSRPGHFRGVATVVTQLFNLVQPDVAVFGEKDYQQLQVLKKMAQDLHFPVEILGAPIVREADGLAMSSRNQYLNEHERKRALGLSQALELARRTVMEGETDAESVIALMSEHLEGSGEIDYVAIVDEMSLTSVLSIDRPVRALVAVQVGLTRLIDNCRLELQVTTP